MSAAVTAFDAASIWVSSVGVGGMPAMRLYMRVAWSAFGACASAFAPRSASAAAQAVERTATDTRRGIAARPTLWLIVSSIPCFMFTSTHASCGFDVAPI